jgi:UDP-glucose 4-epimerase
MVCNAKYVYGDVTKFEGVDGNFDVCFHLAALSRIQPSFKQPVETFHANVLGTQNVCEWARENNVKVIYAGSSSRWHDPYQSPYAMYKYLGEEICKMYKTIYNTKIEIARFYNVYGPHELVDNYWAAVIGIWRRQVQRKQPITIVGDGEQRRDFTHVEDIVDGLVRIMLSDISHDDAWELGSGKNYSVNEVYEMFRKRFGAKKVYLPDQTGNYRRTLRYNDDAVKLLGWNPHKKLEEYIQSL